MLLAGEYIATASAKAYQAETKGDPYEFTTSTQWSPYNNYSNQKDPADDSKTVNAFKGTSSSVDITTVEGKPESKWDGSTTTPAEGATATIDNFVMMIKADAAETKQLKDKKDDNNKTVYNNRDFFGDYMDEVLYQNSPQVYLANMQPDHPFVERYNNNRGIICTGQGAWEEPDTARWLEENFKRLGADIWVDYWGYDVNHDWPWWYKQVQYFVPKLLGEE